MRTNIADSNFQTGALPKGGSMGFKRLPNGKTLVWIDYRRADGVPTHRQTTITSHKMVDIDRAKAQLREKSEAHGSLKNGDITISTLVCHYERKRPENGMDSYLSNIKKSLGRLTPDDDFCEEWESFIIDLEDKGRSVMTVNKYKSAMRAVFNYAKGSKRIKNIPITDWDVQRADGRDRVLNENEKKRLLETSKDSALWLHKAISFSLKNAIRKGDLFSLTKENYDTEKPWIHFQPRKTARKRPRPTYLIILEPEIIEWFNSLPSDCPYLFPRIENGQWSRAGDFKKMWASIIKNANIQDFRFHDLRHCAITYMLDNGYSERDLLNLGIQHTRAMIERYYHYDAEKVLMKRPLQVVNL